MYSIDNMEEISEEFEEIKDLGVIMNNKADFESYIAHIIKKARQKVGWILRSFHSRNINFLKHMYKSLVTPHIDYCSQLWMPTESKDIEKIEKVQRDFLRNIPGLRELDYWDQIKNLKMLSLQRRLERYRII